MTNTGRTAKFRKGTSVENERPGSGATRESAGTKAPGRMAVTIPAKGWAPFLAWIERPPEAIAALT